MEARTDIDDDAVKAKLILSRQTLDGLRITGIYSYIIICSILTIAEKYLHPYFYS